MSIYPIPGSPPRSGSSSSSSSSSSSRPPQTWLSPNRGQQLLANPLPVSPTKLTYPSERPTWYDKTHRLLNTLSSYNQTERMDPMDVDEIRETVLQVINKRDDTESLLLLKLLSEFPLYGVDKIFFEILQSLRNKHPDLNIYFNDLDLDEDGIFPSFSSVAINQILRFFSHRFNIPANVWGSMTASKLPECVRAMVYEEDGVIQGWVVSNDLIKDDPHVVPAFALKKDSIVYLFFFDSIGHTDPSYPDEWRVRAPLSETLRQLENAPDAFDKLQILTYGPARQFAHGGCETFTLIDLKNLIEMHLKEDFDLVSFYESQPSHLQPQLVNDRLPRPSPVPVYEITTLPPQMMKSTQSFTELGKYEKRHPEVETFPEVTRTSATGETYSKRQDFEELGRRVKQSKRMNESNKSRNLYVEQKRMQYTVYLLGTYFGVQILPKDTICTPNSVRRQLFKV